MRILNISFKNINSLEGEGRIDFDRGPIADSGVFAITGPNGSGKTSILDVITLGLYGETFRFDKPAAHVMTKQADECRAQIEFALGPEKFRSSWWLNTPDQVVPEMNLMRLDPNQEILAQTPNQVRSCIADLTGMDFHRFSRTIVLPQGDFAAFLNALDSERMDILEKISGNDLYDVYRRQAEDHYDQARNRLEQLQQDIAAIPLLNQEAIEAAELDLRDFQEQLDELTSLEQVAHSSLSTVQALDQLAKRRDELDQRRAKLLAEVLDYQQMLQRIDDSQTAKTYIQQLFVLDQKHDQLEQQLAGLARLRSELDTLRQQLGDEANLAGSVTESVIAEQKQTIDSLKLTISDIKLELPRKNEIARAVQKQIEDSQSSLADVENWLTAHAADAVLVEDFPDVARLRNLRTDIAELGRKQKSQSNWSKSTTAALKKNKAALEDTRNALNDLKVQIEDDRKSLDAIAQGRSLEMLQGLLEEQQGRVNDFRELCALAEVTSRLTRKGWFSWLSGNKQPEQLDEAELTTQLSAMREEVSREENIIKVLEQAIRNEAMIKKMSADRARLIEGQPCYLCGSVDHPYVRKLPASSDAKKALIEQRGKIQELKSQIERTAALLKSAEKNSLKLTTKQTRLLQIRSHWTMLANRLMIFRDGMSIDNIGLQKHLFDEETEELNKIKVLVKDFGQLQRNIAKAEADIEIKQTLLEQLTESLAELENTWNQRPTDFSDIEQRYQQCQVDEKALVAKLEGQLGSLGEKFPGKGKENALFDRLNTRRQDYQVYLLRQKGLADEVKALTEQFTGHQSDIIAHQERLASCLEALGTAERRGLCLAWIEKQKDLVDQENALSITQMEYDAMLVRLSEALAANGLGSIDDLRVLADLLQRETELQQHYLRIKPQLDELERQRAEIHLQIGEKLEQQADSNWVEADIQQELHRLSERINIAEQEIQTLQNKLDKQQAYRERYLSLKQQCDDQEQLFEQALQELTLVRDEQGGFRRRIQQVMIDKLLSNSNRILEKLSGRYYIRAAATEKGLALEIEDTKQKNIRRLPRSLSGGESFVVSLALALALAEMANNGSAIDSLFLDEGFGSLDAESLYLAMTALEELKTQGKTVGVISHVDAVKKRIKTQIELVKKANGLSELKLVA
ncbi:MAG: hypothetical protein RL563_519 [Pseudomonadota bacterium]